MYQLNGMLYTYHIGLTYFWNGTRFFICACTLMNKIFEGYLPEENFSSVNG